MKNIITLAPDGCDRATAYHMSNKVMRRADGLYVSWLDIAYRTIIARVDPQTGKTLCAYPIIQGYDNHCSATLLSTPDGKLHAISGSHAQGFVHRWSENPADPQSWSLPEGVGMAATYPSLICDRAGTLYLAHRYTGANWGVHWNTRAPGGYWSWPYMLVKAPATGYTYPTNSLAISPDGVIHLLVEFYKTYPEEKVESHTAAITHIESPDGGKTWYHDDGRKVGIIPICLEDTHPVKFKGGGDLRPGNLTILPDGQVAFPIWDKSGEKLELAVRRGPANWDFYDLSKAVTEGRPGWKPNLFGQVAVDREGKIILVAQIAEDTEWASPSSELRVLRIDPASGRALRFEEVPKLDADVPDWLACIEKVVGTPAHDLFMIYTSGCRGEGCVNDARCKVRLVELT